MEQLDEGLRLQVQDALIPSDKLQLLSNDMLGKGEFIVRHFRMVSFNY